MSDKSVRPIKTGGDPRALPDFLALKNEINKLTHPARPDVDWVKVEMLALRLFEHNGVELETAAWYTLAKTTTSSACGMSEGLSIIRALITQQWSVMWPSQMPARMIVISGLSQRLQTVFCTLPLTRDDLPSLYDCDWSLRDISEALSRQALKPKAQLVSLCRKITQAIIRLENSAGEKAADYKPATADPSAGMAMTDFSADADPSSADTHRPRLVYIIRPEPAVTNSVDPAFVDAPEAEDITKDPEAFISTPRWPAFVAGMVLASVLCGLSLMGWIGMQRDTPAGQALATTVTPLPELLNDTQLNTLRAGSRLVQRSAPWLQEARRLLDSLSALPPDWNLRYGDRLLMQGRTLWPWIDDITQLQYRWQQQSAANTLPSASLTGWHDGMTQLQSLADRLNALDGRKGEYITVSELKSRVSGMQTHFRQAVPVEEQLRQVQVLPEDSPVRQQRLRLLEQHLRAQIYTLNQATTQKSSPEKENEY
ncbi:TPA: hypothetical protein JG914_004535 [Enterobacter hormaechei subsp. steigerwaltii]|nr:hypothetical protein [Enterobacter hormaechei subsp. steigerwaltii]